MPIIIRILRKRKRPENVILDQLNTLLALHRGCLDLQDVLSETISAQLVLSKRPCLLPPCDDQILPKSQNRDDKCKC